MSPIKRAFCFFVFVIAGLVVAGSAGAAPIGIGATVVPTPSLYLGPLLADTGLVPLLFDSATGSVREIVVADADNPFGAGDLSFVLQVTATSGSITDIALGSV